VWSQSEQRQTAISLEQQGKTSEAEAAWKAILKEQASNPEPFAHLGLLEARQEHYSEAIRMYRKAYALAPGMPGLRLNLGLSLFKNGDYRQAIEIFAQVQQVEHDDKRRYGVL
jgi:predicted Zn-dependent protease